MAKTVRATPPDAPKPEAPPLCSTCGKAPVWRPEGPPAHHYDIWAYTDCDCCEDCFKGAECPPCFERRRPDEEPLQW